MSKEKQPMVEVFSTNIQTEKLADMLLEQFKKIYPTYRFNFDLEDCDNILRVESSNGKMDVNGIKRVVREYGFTTEVLPDIPVINLHETGFKVTNNENQ